MEDYARLSTGGKNWVVGIIGLIAFLALLAIFVPAAFSSVISISPYLILFAIVFYAFFRIFIKIYGETERGIIYRLGSFSRVAGPGWAFIAPFFEKEFKKVDIRTVTEILEGISIVTRDDIPLQINATFFYAIVDPAKAVLKVTALEDAIKNFVFGVIRDGIGTFLMREVFSNVEEINVEMKKRLVFMTDEWGIDVKNIEILKVQVPDIVMAALIQPITAEQRAIAARFAAEAKRVIIEVLGDAGERLNSKTLAYLYLKALEKISSSAGSRVVLPMSFPSLVDDLTRGMGFGMGLKGINEEGAIDAVAKRILAGKDGK